MGYTHYFPQSKNCPKAAFAAIVRDFKLVMSKLGKDVKLAGGNGKGKPVVDDTRIAFNGTEKNDLYHETMEITQKSGRDFSFCKTARKPYDIAVVALLVLMEKHAPGTWDISSDGDPSDWQDGLALVKRVLASEPGIEALEIPNGVSR